MRTVRISDLRRGHLRAEFVPKLRVESFHRSDSEGCTIVTIERHSPDRFSTGPLYMCAPRARGLAPSRAFLLYRTDLPTLPRTAPFCVSAEVLANHRRCSKRLDMGRTSAGIGGYAITQVQHQEDFPDRTHGDAVLAATVIGRRIWY